MKDVKNSDEKNGLIEVIDGFISGNKKCIDVYNKYGDTYDRIENLNNEITDLNKIEQALINYKIYK